MSKKRPIQSMIHQYNLRKKDDPDFVNELICRMIHELAVTKKENLDLKSKVDGQADKLNNLKVLLQRRVMGRKSLDNETKFSLCNHIDDIWKQNG
jgi:hypothetical protein